MTGIAGDPDFRLGINMGMATYMTLATTGGNGSLNNISVDGGWATTPL